LEAFGSEAVFSRVFVAGRSVGQLSWRGFRLGCGLRLRWTVRLGREFGLVRVGRCVLVVKPFLLLRPLFLDGGVAAVILGSLVAAGEDVVGVVDLSVASA